MRQVFRSAVIAAAALGAAALAVPTPALAWHHGGVFVGISPFPVIVGPPVVYAPPPAYYPPAYYPYAYPPPVAYAPAPVSRFCYTPRFSCPLPPTVAPGVNCSCPVDGGGLVGGRAG